MTTTADTLVFVRTWLATNREQSSAIPLLEAIAGHAKTDGAYCARFETWLAFGGTLIIRDDLALPFQDADFIRAQSPQRRYAWDDAWMALDSAMLHARVADGRAPPFYRSPGADA